MAQVATDACGTTNWGNDSKCRRLKKHNGSHCDRYGDRWENGNLADDGYCENDDRLAKRRGKFPNYTIKRIVFARKEETT